MEAGDNKGKIIGENQRKFSHVTKDSLIAG